MLSAENYPQNCIYDRFVFFHEWVQMKDGEPIGPSKSQSWRCTFFYLPETHRRFPVPRRFMSWWHCLTCFRNKLFSQKGARSALGPLETIPDLFWPTLNENHIQNHIKGNSLKHKPKKNNMEFFHSYPLKGAAMCISAEVLPTQKWKHWNSLELNICFNWRHPGWSSRVAPEPNSFEVVSV